MLRPFICLVVDAMVYCPNLPSGTETLIPSAVDGVDHLQLSAECLSRTHYRDSPHSGSALSLGPPTSHDWSLQGYKGPVP